MDEKSTEQIIIEILKPPQSVEHLLAIEQRRHQLEQVRAEIAAKNQVSVSDFAMKLSVKWEQR